MEPKKTEEIVAEIEHYTDYANWWLKHRELLQLEAVDKGIRVEYKNSWKKDGNRAFRLLVRLRMRQDNIIAQHKPDLEKVAEAKANILARVEKEAKLAKQLFEENMKKICNQIPDIGIEGANSDVDSSAETLEKIMTEIK